MRKLAIVFLTLFMLLVSGCTDQPDAQPDRPAIPETTKAPAQVTETQAAAEAVSTDAVEEGTDAASGATPTESVKCLSCGAPENHYDGYCYYCHPDHGFHCSNCGYYWPEPRPDSGMCRDCEAAAETVDAYTGATG